MIHYMTNKTYNQYCAIAHALDAIGDRWTLLVVRNLLAGPRRFSDLLRGLPGISTNILTDRLKSLEEEGLIATRYLPPPAASTVYELTETGFGLVPVLTSLAQWGGNTLGAPQPGQAIVPESLVFMLLGMFWRPEPPVLELTCEIHVQDEWVDQRYVVRLSPQGADISEGAPDEADVGVRLPLTALLILSGHRATLASLRASRVVSVTGDEAQQTRLMSWVDGK